MVITSAFQADFVGSSPITRKGRKKVFRGGIKHVKKKMALDTAISQSKVDENPRAQGAKEDWVPFMQKHREKATLGKPGGRDLGN